MAVAAASLPLVEKGGKAIVDMANVPVIGWERIREYRHGKKELITEKASFQLRAWEIVLGAGLLWLFYGAPLPNGKSFFSFDPFNVLGEESFNPVGFDPFHILPTIQPGSLLPPIQPSVLMAQAVQTRVWDGTEPIPSSVNVIPKYPETNKSPAVWNGL